MIDENKELVAAKAKLMASKNAILKVIADKEVELKGHQDNLDNDVTINRERFREDSDKEIDELYKDRVVSLTQRIQELDIQIAQIEMDENDESVREAIERRDYLNSAAIKVQEYYNILLHVSELEFIEYAVTTKSWSFSKFRKEMARIDFYKLEVAKLESKSVASNTDRNIWIQALTFGWFNALRLPLLVMKAVKRARKLHIYSQMYYIFVESLLLLSQSTNKEILETLQGVVAEREFNLYERKQAVVDELNTLSEKIQSDKDAAMEHCPDYADKIADVMYAIQETITGKKKELDEVEEQLRVVTEKLDIILGKEAAAFREIRERFLNPSNTEKSLNLPAQLLWSYTDSKNNYFAFVDGLWIYTDRGAANNMVLSVIYQLRNYMAWGSIVFHVFDVLMATFLNSMRFPENCDIRVHSLQDDQKSIIDVLHDTLTRRTAIVFAAHDDIHQYNNYQIGIDAPTLPYELVIIFQEQVTTLPEKLVQILGLGAKLGIMVCVFLRIDLLSEGTFKTYERYVSNIVELSKTGVTRHIPAIFGQRFEKKTPPKSVSKTK